MRGLLAGLDRKNCWNLAEHTPGWPAPQKLQRLLRTARWDADKVAMTCEPPSSTGSAPAAC